MAQDKPVAYGGQAVVEGVMFAGKSVNVTAVRRKDQSIDYLEVPREEKSWSRPLKRIPFIRGLVGIIEAAGKGAKHMNFAFEAYATDEMQDKGDTETDADPDNGQSAKKESPFSLSMILTVAVVGVLSFVAGKLIFTLAPAMVEQWLLSGLFKNQILHNLIAGVIELIFLFAYIFAISQTPLMKRLFQYHGAEHKVISAYEAKVELTVPNVQRFSTLHYRCGSSFIVLSVIVGIIIYSLIHYDNIWQRLLDRIILLPIVVGAAYEALRMTNAVRDIPVLRYLGYPGLWLQYLTTKQPMDEQVEVAIASFKRMMEIDKEKRVKPIDENEKTA